VGRAAAGVKAAARWLTASEVVEVCPPGSDAEQPRPTPRAGRRVSGSLRWL